MLKGVQGGVRHEHEWGVFERPFIIVISCSSIINIIIIINFLLLLLQYYCYEWGVAVWYLAQHPHQGPLTCTILTLRVR